MATKLYIAKAAAYCPFVKLPGHENKQPIQFHFGRHSTSDEVEQKALEAHASFGKSFYLVKGQPPPLPTEATPTTVGAVTTAGRPVGLPPKPAPPVENPVVGPNPEDEVKVEPNPKSGDESKAEPGPEPQIDPKDETKPKPGGKPKK